MRKKKQRTKVYIDVLASERLSIELNSSVDQLELEVQSLPKSVEPPNEGDVTVTLNLTRLAKKLLAWLIPLRSFGWSLVKLIVTIWSNVKSLFHH